MGMFDEINGEQIKTFYTAFCTLAIDDPIFGKSNSELSPWFSGGSLKYFKNGDTVPYQTFWYNMGKDFNILDFNDWQGDEPIAHIIRDGKVVKTINISDITEEELQFDNYDYNDSKLNIHTKEDLIAFNDARKAVIDKIDNEKNDAHRALSEFVFSGKEDEEEFKKLMDAADKEQEENDKMLEPYIAKRNSFLIDDTNDEYIRIGAIINTLLNSIEHLDYKFNAHVFLKFIVTYNHFLEILNGSKLDDYMNGMNFDEDFKKEILKNIDVIKEYYETIKDYVPQKADIENQYDFKNIESGRYDVLYKKYNIKPYQEFDKFEKNPEH